MRAQEKCSQNPRISEVTQEHHPSETCLHTSITPPKIKLNIQPFHELLGNIVIANRLLNAGKELTLENYQSNRTFDTTLIKRLGETLFDGVKSSEKLAPLFGYGYDSELQPIIDASQELPSFPRNLSTLNQARPDLQLDIEATGNDDFVALVLKRDEDGNILDEIIVYDNVSAKNKFLSLSDRSIHIGEPVRSGKHTFQSTLIDIALERLEQRGEKVTDGKGYGPEKTKRKKGGSFLERLPDNEHPLELIYTMLHDPQAISYTSSLHYSLAIGMILEGIIAPTQHILMRCADVFTPDLQDYLTGMKQLLIATTEADEPMGVPESSFLREPLLREAKGMPQLAGFEREVAASQLLRANLLAAGEQEIEFRDNVAKERFTIAHLLKFNRMLVGEKVKETADAVDTSQGQIFKIETGSRSSHIHLIRALVARIKPSQHECVNEFVNSLVRSWEALH